MNATDVIALVEQLPASERLRVLTYFRQQDQATLAEVPPPGGSVDDPAFQAAATRVFAEHRTLFELLAK